MKIFLDLDGVIANFSKAACKRLDIKYPSKHEFKQKGEFFSDIPEGIFYSTLKGHDFWADLEIFPYANELVEVVNNTSKGNWMFLTKPMLDPGCYSGKYEWIKKHFPKYTNKLIIINGTKSACCKGADNVLIDDLPKNITEWVNAGGQAIRWVEKTDDFDKEWYSMKIEFVKYFLNERKDPIEI